MPDTTIAAVHGRRMWDSRGRPTVEAEVHLACGARGRALAPSRRAACRGKSGGYRTLIAYSRGRRAVFLLGFAKNERENIDPKQLADLKTAATDILTQTDYALDMQIEEGRLQEVDYDHEEDEG